jgi:peptidoglycan/xylan/chitin deacetylase (PgdA/CDA1 family)
MTLRFSVTDVPGPRRDLVGYGSAPPVVQWPGGAKIAVNIAVNAEEGSEVSFASGDGRNEGLGEIPYGMSAEYRDLCVESIYEYGARAGIWRLLRLFEEYRLRTTFFAAAVALERNREVAEWIGRGGHEVCSHGWRWEEPWLLSRDEEREHIQAAIASFEHTVGARPVGWYCRYGPSVHTRELLVEEGGFVYDSDSYADDLPYYVSVGGARHLVVPYTMVYNDVKLGGPGGTDLGAAGVHRTRPRRVGRLVHHPRGDRPVLARRAPRRTGPLSGASCALLHRIFLIFYG